MKTIFIAFTILFQIFFSNLFGQNRDTWQQPEKVMDKIGVKPGMVIGEAGAGHGYFTFKLAKRVGKEGKIYANDISQSALDAINNQAQLEDIQNISTILGQTEDPLFPDVKLDMIMMVYALHDLEKPVEFLKNLEKYLKKGSTLIILEQEPAKTGDYHFWPQEKVLEIVKKAGYKLKKKETFLQKDTIYILKLNNAS